jgi:hypothetical protein
MASFLFFNPTKNRHTFYQKNVKIYHYRTNYKNEDYYKEKE